MADEAPHNIERVFAAMVNAFSENWDGKVRYKNWGKNDFWWSLADYEAEGFQRTYVTYLFKKRVTAVSNVLHKFDSENEHRMISWEKCSVWDFGAGPGNVSLGIVNFLRSVTSGHADPRVNLLDPVVAWEPCTRILENEAGIERVNFQQHNSLLSMAEALEDYESDEDELLIVGLGHVLGDFGHELGDYGGQNGRQAFWRRLLDAGRGRALLVVLLERWPQLNGGDLPNDPNDGFQVKYVPGFDKHSKENAAVLYMRPMS